MQRPLLAVALLLFASLAIGQTTNGRASKITSANLARLRKSGLRVLVPTYVPRGFKVRNFSLYIDPKDKVMSTVFVEYADSKGSWFRLQMVSEGIGDAMFTLADGNVVDPTGILQASSPTLGKVPVEFYKEGNVRMFQCNWVELKDKMPNYVMVHGEGIEAPVGKRIIEGLRILK